MKDFQEFINSLTQDDFNKLADSVNDSGGQKVPLKDVGGAILSKSVVLNFEVLRLYHQWLHEQN